MSLSDPEILELHELCGALADERLTAAQQSRLGALLQSSAEARTLYFHSIALSSSLAEYAGEMQADAPEVAVRRTRFKTWSIAALAAAACVAAGAFVFLRHAPQPEAVVSESADAEMQTNALVARITGSKDCVWRGAAPVRAGDVIRRGTVLDLESGVAELTFDCGAQLVLEGPATLEAVSAWETTLRRGALKATVPVQAAGFRVHHPSVEVVDLGTEFSMVADAAGDAEVRVLKGSVEVSPASEDDSGPAILKESETRRFGKNRKGARGDFDRRHARLAGATELDRWHPLLSFTRWSFDEVTDGAFRGETAGTSTGNEIRNHGATLTTGRWSQALHLNGSVSLSAPAPGMSRPGSRTVAFWVRVPRDASLAEAPAFIGWPLPSRKFGNRALHVGWNRNPNQGPVGALRTELGKVYAVGATALRDGEWHHIAVTLTPIGAADGPLQVTQYVDGRLEGATARSIKLKHATSDGGPPDVLWIGPGQGKHKKDRSHFVGDLDELVIADRALSPSEIISLMSRNALPRQDIASF